MGFDRSTSLEDFGDVVVSGKKVTVLKSKASSTTGPQ